MVEETQKDNLPGNGEDRGELEKCEREKKEYLEGWQRAKADFINYKKDETKRLEDLTQFVIMGVTADFLPVLDSFDLALKNTGENEKGILLIKSQMLDALKKRGIEQIQVKPGDAFDPEKQESIGEIESELPPGTIAEEVQKGYVFRERVLRPVRIRLAKGK